MMDLEIDDRFGELEERLRALESAARETETPFPLSLDPPGARPALVGPTLLPADPLSCEWGKILNLYCADGTAWTKSKGYVTFGKVENVYGRAEYVKFPSFKPCQGPATPPIGLVAPGVREIAVNDRIHWLPCVWPDPQHPTPRIPVLDVPVSGYVLRESVVIGGGLPLLEYPGGTYPCFMMWPIGDQPNNYYGYDTGWWIADGTHMTTDLRDRILAGGDLSGGAFLIGQFGGPKEHGHDVDAEPPVVYGRPNPEWPAGEVLPAPSHARDLRIQDAIPWYGVLYIQWMGLGNP